MSEDPERWRAWIGRHEEVEDTIDLGRARAMQATLDDPGAPAPEDAPWRRRVPPDPVLLFRYSALTFNGHRIHYDLKFATGEEGYPGLVVHGPLLATLMVELVRRARPQARITGFRFRAERPIFDTAPFTVAGAPAPDGKSAQLWVADAEGCYASRGSVELA